MAIQNKKIVIWDLDNCFEIALAKNLKYELFPNCEIKTKSPRTPKYNKNLYPSFDNNNINVVVKDYFFCKDSVPIKIDLGWADLLIHYTQEIIKGPWQEYCEQIHKSFNNKNFITIASGSHNLNEYPIDNTYLKLAHFFSNIVEHCHDEEEYNNEKIKPKMFDALLGTSKPHRVFVIENILKNGLEDVSLINIWKGANNVGLNYRSKDLDQFEDPAIVSQTKIGYSMNRTPGIKNGYSLAQSIPTKIYKNSWYSIVAETEWRSNDFFTEKTAKCFFAKRIFVLFGAQGQLKKLRELGYKTFDNVIDESYDDIEKQDVRWKLAFNEVMKLSNLDPLEVYSKTNDRLEYNKKQVSNQIKRLESLKNFLQKHLEVLK